MVIMSCNQLLPDTTAPLLLLPLPGVSEKVASSSNSSSSDSDLFFDFEFDEEKNAGRSCLDIYRDSITYAKPDSKEEEKWEEKHTSTLNDMLHPNHDENYETAKEEEEDSEEEGKETVCIAKHKIATSKLAALLKSLERDRKMYKVPPSPRKESSISFKPESDDNNASSPANFSYLSSSATAATAVAPRPPAHKLGHSISLPGLTSWEREYMESPKFQQRRPKTLDLAESNTVTITKGAAQNEPVTPEPVPYKRSSSLKSGKTPPEMASRRKIVRFADVLGLDLADVKFFFAGELPKVPKCAYADLQDTDHLSSDSDSSDTLPKLATMATAVTSTSCIVAVTAAAETLLVPMFSQPGRYSNFFDLLEQKKVCLEEARMSGPHSISGTIRVWNVGFEKEVTVRYSTNEWIQFTDLEAQYQDDSCDGCSDKFIFILGDLVLVAGQRLQLCVKYLAGKVEYWDSNDGKNYVFQCVKSCSETFLGASPED